MQKLSVPNQQNFSRFLKDVESKWFLKLLNRFEREKFVGHKQEELARLPRYVLSMFPYPSGNLHLGHVRIYTSSDLIARYHRLLANDKMRDLDYAHVINPMGFDSFGLPAENAAKERGLDPAEWTKSNIRSMKKQLDGLAFQFDWREATSNPSFYKWTQHLFLKLLDAGLAYKSYGQVNWDPVDKTVLADEQVDENGLSWRSGALVEKRYLKQWFIKTNAFTNDIYEAKDIDLDSWGDIVAIQRNWIGKPEGWLFYLPMGDAYNSDVLPVFTERPENFLDSGCKVILSKTHWFPSVYSDKKLMNPFTSKEMDVILAEEVDSPGCQASITSALAQEDVLNRDKVLMLAKLKNLGGYFTSSKYRDWLVSRQRYWGTPIPVLQCACGYIGVGNDALPVALPSMSGAMNHAGDNNELDGFRLTQVAPQDWLKAPCPCGKSMGERESDTLDTLFDSSWYFLRYASKPPETEPFDRKLAQPVSCYIGGKEHAAMHLFYARFITHFLFSRGEISFREPFKALVTQSIVKSRTYKHDGQYLSIDDLAKYDSSSITIEYEKMSKSKNNGVNPQELIVDYGIDATRFCLMDHANPQSERLWRSSKEEFRDCLIFLRRVALTVQEYTQALASKVEELDPESLDRAKESLIEIRNKSALDSSFNIEKTYQFRQYIVVMHVLTNKLRNNLRTSSVYTKEFAEALAALLVLLNPITPHLSEELWDHFSKCTMNPLRHDPVTRFNMLLQASDQPWPRADVNYPLTIKVRDLRESEYCAKLSIEPTRFAEMSQLDIGDEVKDYFKSRNESCKVLEVIKYEGYFASVVCKLDNPAKRKRKTKQ